MTIDYTKETTQYTVWNDIADDQLAPLVPNNSFPLDRRTVIDSLTNLGTVVPKIKRYRGLRIFVLEDQKEYWFKDDVTTTSLVPYHTPAYIVDDINNADHSISTEVIVLANDVATPYVWNGTSWVRFSGTGGSGTVSGPITSSNITDASSDPESDNYPENVCITKRLPKLLFS